MTTVAVVIDEDTVSADVLELDIWGRDLSVGRWRVVLKNLADTWGGDFHSNDPVTLTINATDMMKGYLDDSKDDLDDRGVYTNKMVVDGRDYGRDLARLKHTYDCLDTKADDVFDALLAAKGSEITFTSPSTAPVVNFDRSRTYLIDWLRAIAKRVNYSAYVDITKALHFFALGAVAEESGIALTSIAAAVDNNILHLLKGEEIGVSIANKVELTAGSLWDHYSDANAKPSAIITGAYTECAIDVDNGASQGILTADGGTPFNIFSAGEEIIISNSENGNEGRYTIEAVADTVLITDGIIAGGDNADDETIIVSPWGNWIPGEDCNVANETTILYVGTSSVKFFNTVAAMPQITLDFTDTLYSYSTLDLSKAEEISFYIYHNNAGETVVIKPQLEDNAGKIIEFYRGIEQGVGTSEQGVTVNIPANRWHKIRMPSGENVILSTGPVYNNRWYNLGAPGFDWSNVVKITFKAVQRNPLPPPTDIDLAATSLYLDNLTIPGVEVIALDEDATSIAAYGSSEWWEPRYDIKSVIELEVIAAKELANRKDPLQTIKVIAKGQIGLKYPGQSVTVQAPGHGLAAATKYRIVTLHHQVRVNPIIKGEDFITTLDLVKHTINPTQVIDPLRHELVINPYGAMLELLNLARRREHAVQATPAGAYGSPPPADPSPVAATVVVDPGGKGHFISLQDAVDEVEQ